MEPIKIIGIVGSPRKGNTETMVRAALDGAKEDGADINIILLSKLNLEMCDGCLECDKTGKCHFNDGMNEINENLAEASGFIIGTPTRWSLLSGNLKVFLDRTNPLATPGKLIGKAAGIIAVGQSHVNEKEESILKAANSLRNYCENAGIEVIDSVQGYEALVEDDIQKNIKSIEDCKLLGKELIKYIKANHAREIMIH
jgi:multimeric flavodoxin WrbA